MAELPLDAEETGSDLPEGLAPPGNSDGSDGVSPPEPPPAQSMPAASHGAVLLRDRYLVDSGKPLPEFDAPTAKAYAVEDRRDLGNQLLALVCTPGFPIRLSAIRLLKDGDIPGVLPLVDWDSIMWPALGRKSLIIIYQRPLGGRVVDRLARKETKITEYDMPRRVIEPLSEALQKLESGDGPHRAIRPENIYFLDEDMEDIVLGPHMTAPPGHDQPTMLEPIDRAMAQPAGRGLGDSRDDIYALGVTVVLLLLGHNPVASMKDEDLLKARLEHGSYTAICGAARIPMQLIEPLRGMLADDPAERWDFAEIAKWLTGLKITPVKKKPMNKSEIFFKFRGTEHYSPRSLARHFARHPNDAVKAINGEEFETWVKRGLESKEKTDAIKGAIQTSKFHEDNHQGTDDFLICRVTAILDPDGPIRYKGLAFMHDGYGPVLATEWVRNNNPQPAAEALSHDVSGVWYGAQEKLKKEHIETQTTFTQLRGLLAIQDPGYGLERVLYEANPGMSCQSPFVAEDYVLIIEQLLPALDDAANSGGTSSQPIDNHVAAFIAARFNEDIHPHLKALASNKAETSIVGTLSLLAFLQWKLRTPALLGLSSWVGGLLGPAINAYHNRHTRQDLERDIPRLVRKGSLPELFNLIDDAEKRQEDSDGFAVCRAEWLEAEEEIRDIEGAGDERLTKAERSGQQAAAMFSISIALTVIAVLVLAEMM